MEQLAVGGAHYELRAGGELVEYLAQGVLPRPRTTGLESTSIYGKSDSSVVGSSTTNDIVVRCVDRQNDTLSRLPDARAAALTQMRSAM
jgi:hypothetical protein